MNIKVGRYGKDSGALVMDHPVNGPVTVDSDGRVLDKEGIRVGHIEPQYQGWIEDAEKTWIAFVDVKGRPTFYLNRCSRGCGAVVDSEGEDCGRPHAVGAPGWTAADEALASAPRGHVSAPPLAAYDAAHARDEDPPPHHPQARRGDSHHSSRRRAAD